MNRPDGGSRTAQGPRTRAESMIFDLLRRFNGFLAPLVIRFGFLNGIIIRVREGERSLWIRPFSLDWFVLKEIFERNIYAARIGNGDMVVDLGAHVGLFSVYAASRGAMVMAYEPDPDNLEVFRVNVASNGLVRRISIVPCAVWKEDGTKEMYFPRNKGNNSFFPFGTTGRKVQVPCVSLTKILDAIPGEISVLKVDIEGAEYDVLDGADLSKVRQICLEYHTHSNLGPRLRPLFESLRKDGFSVSVLGEYALSGYAFAIRE